MRNQLAAISILATLTAMVLPITVTSASADPDTGNNGQCRQVQKLLPQWLQDYEGCHDTFTGPGHNYPPPLP
jgi:hypothetical protein